MRRLLIWLLVLAPWAVGLAGCSTESKGVDANVTIQEAPKSSSPPPRDDSGKGAKGKID
jgi:hypothetical protein